MRTFTRLGVLTVCHVAATVLVQAFTYASGMARFDSGLAAGPVEQGASKILSILLFPLVSGLLRGGGPVPSSFDGGLGYVPFALNGLLWASAILGCVSLHRRYRARGTGMSG
jgi:hypothetical protein